MERLIGIDLGTTNSVVAYFENDKPSVIPNSEGANTTPSVVFFEGDEAVVGELAKRQLVANPSHTISSIKRLMGLSFSELKALNLDVHYELEEGDDDTILIKVGDAKFTPEELCAKILKKMKETAEDFFGEAVNEAVITVPAYFNDTQRQATKRAAGMAGLGVQRIINEPTAAALSYGIDQSASEMIAVFDFGGGTFDISVLEIDKDVFEVVSTCGDTHLGGQDIDDILVKWVLASVKEKLGVDVSADPKALQRVRESVEKAKCELSTLPATLISLPYLYADESGVKHFEKKIDREEFNKLIEPILNRLFSPCRKVLADVALTPRDLDNVILVGGSTRIPAVQAAVKTFFGREPLKTVNPDEAVALGASIQSGIIGGHLQEVLLIDVTPLSLGIELEGELYSVIIPRNSSVPTTASKHFTTTVDNQSTVRVHILQGERKIALENHSLGLFKLTGVAPAPREVPDIEVKLHIDANGILSVSAMDLASSVKSEVIIETYRNMVDRDYTKDIEKAQSKLQEDLEKVKKIEQKNKAISIKTAIEKFMRESSDELTEEDTNALEELIVKFDFALIKDDVDTIAELQQKLVDIGNKYPDLFYLHLVD